MRWSHLGLLIGLALSGILWAVSGQIDDYVVGVLVLVGINIILASSLNLVNGHTGQFSPGHAGFMAVGAYSSSAVTLLAGPALLKIFGGPGVLANGLLFTTA